MGEVKSRRRRRTAEEARRAILKATEKRLIEGGPDALRLQEVAAEVGITHSTVLHHFGSRERLLEAFTQHAVGVLRKDLVSVFERSLEDGEQSRQGRGERVVDRLEEVSGIFRDRGYARLLAWLILADRPVAPAEKRILDEVEPLLEARENSEPTPIDDEAAIRLGTSMAMVSLFGDALIDALGRSGMGLSSDTEVGSQLRRWIVHGMESPSASNRTL